MVKKKKGVAKKVQKMFNEKDELKKLFINYETTVNRCRSNMNEKKSISEADYTFIERNQRTIKQKMWVDLALQRIKLSYFYICFELGLYGNFFHEIGIVHNQIINKHN